MSGFAVGAGAGIALLADTVVMGEGATIGFPFFRIGLVPDYGILFSLPRRVGAARARQILLYARMLKGHRGEAVKELQTQLNVENKIWMYNNHFIVNSLKRKNINSLTIKIFFSVNKVGSS